MSEPRGKTGAPATWNAALQDLLKAAWMKDTSIKEAAAVLGMPIGHVKRAAAYFGLPPRESLATASSGNRAKTRPPYWTRKAVARLVHLHRKGLSVDEAAAALRITAAKVRLKAEELGLVLKGEEILRGDEIRTPVRKVPIWTKERIASLRNLHQGGVNVVEIAHFLGVDPDEIRRKILELRTPRSPAVVRRPVAELPPARGAARRPSAPQDDPVSLFEGPITKRRGWTRPRLERLASLRAEGLGYREIAAEMSAPVHRVRARGEMIGLPPRFRASTPWTPRQEAILRDGFARGQLLFVIARRIDRRLSDVIARRRRLDGEGS
jgi:hypothetical protein